jgi:hypothetical protein
MAVDPRFTEAPPEAAPPHARWYHKLAAFVYIVFCFEIGVFLLLFPWVELWDRNYFSALAPAWETVWNSPYFKGAVSGLGLIDIGISFAELLRLRRFARPADPRP